MVGVRDAYASKNGNGMILKNVRLQHSVLSALWGSDLVSDSFYI